MNNFLNRLLLIKKATVVFAMNTAVAFFITIEDDGAFYRLIFFTESLSISLCGRKTCFVDPADDLPLIWSKSRFTAV